MVVLEEKSVCMKYCFPGFPGAVYQQPHQLVFMLDKICDSDTTKLRRVSCVQVMVFVGKIVMLKQLLYEVLLYSSGMQATVQKILSSSLVQRTKHNR